MAGGANADRLKQYSLLYTHKLWEVPGADGSARFPVDTVLTLFKHMHLRRTKKKNRECEPGVDDDRMDFESCIYDNPTAIPLHCTSQGLCMCRGIH